MIFLYHVSGVNSFRVLSTASGSNNPHDIPVIEVTFKDGQKDELVLKRHNPLFRSRNIDHNRVCNYLGHLKNEVDATVAVTGCPDEKNQDELMFITLISKRSIYQKSFSMDFTGHVESIQVSEAYSRNLPVRENLSSRNENIFVEGDEIGDTEEETKSQNTVVGGSSSVPFAIKAKIKLGTDASASDTITNKLNSTVDAWISEILTHVQAHYHHPTLRHRINFEVQNIYNFEMDIIQY